MKGLRTGGSLRARLALGMCGVLLPFAFAAAAGVFYLLPALILPMERIIGEVVEEMEPVRQLQMSLLLAGIQARRGKHGEGAGLGARVDEAFERVRAAPFSDPREWALIDAARREWQQARALDPGSHAAAFHAEGAAAILDGIYIPARGELEHSRGEARKAKARSLWVTIAAFALALAVSLYAGTWLAGPIVGDVDALRGSAMALAGGELSHRAIVPLTTELGDLAMAFNAMAQRIEADQAALAQLATRDSLSGLLNRREFLRLLREELERSRRYRHACALLLLDIDHFKAVNDSWGHPAGDGVLRATAALILNEARPTDRAARYGGEEFALLLPETGAPGALAAAERVRAAIAATPITLSPDRAIPVTVSIGVAIFPADGADEEALVSSADKNLYAAKGGGRNRVVGAAA